MALASKRTLLGMFLTTAILLTTGCDQTAKNIEQANSPSTPRGRLTSNNSPAGALIEQCVNAYQKLTSYEDSGRVRLSYSLDGQLLEDIAPLSIALERPNRLGIKAYRVQAGTHADRWRMRVGEGTDAPLPNQVVSRNIPDKLDLTWISSDVVAVQYLSAGLAGFPPQLDLLLSASPLSGLVDEAATLTMGRAESIGDHKCHVVKILSSGSEYRLWIDQSTKLLRRLEMPQANLPPSMLEDTSISDIRLTIEFEGVRVNQPIDWKKWQVASSQSEQLVSHFVMPPPPLTTSALGKQIPAFMLSSADGREVMNSQKSAGKQVTVLLWLADHPTCRASASQLAEVARQHASRNAAQVQFVAVWAEPSPPAGATFADLAQSWNLPMEIAVDRLAVGRDLFGIREAPTLVVLDSHNRLQIQEERGNPMLSAMLPEILDRLVAGENLAEGIVQNARTDQDRFLAELFMAAAVDANMSAFSAPSPYPPQMVKLNELARTESTSDILALATDDSQIVWMLRSSGILEQLDSQGQTEKKYEPKWSYSSLDQVRLQIAPGGQFVAACTRASDQVNLLDTRSKYERTVQLTEGQRVTDMGWLNVADSKSPRLAILTSDRRTLLVDPESGQQMSGECPAEPLAVVPQSLGSVSSHSQVVLADRRVEPLVYSQSNTIARLVKPASHTASPGPANTANESANRLQFQPNNGPWSIMNDQESTTILARGWFAVNEPAVYLLDEQLQQQWHYRLPLTRGDGAWPLATVARDPVSGQPTFFVVGPSQTVHLLRADGQVSDHFQLDQPICGIASLASGDHLQLLVAHPRQLVRYRIDPVQIQARRASE